MIARDCKFESAIRCGSFLEECFAQEKVVVNVSAEAVSWGMRPSCEAPKFLFRGEPDIYPQTIASGFRLEQDRTLVEEDRAEIGLLIQALAEWLSGPESNFEMRRHEAFGLLQHLGLPTNYIDFSDDIEVALSFAVGCKASGRVAKVGVLDVKRSISDNAGQLADIRDHKWCDRAKRQRAYAYAPMGFRDLKSEGGRNATNSWWLEFDVTALDVQRFQPKYMELLDEPSDACAGLLVVLINDYVRGHGPLRKPVADWLISKIPMVPLVAEASSFDLHSHLPLEVEFLAPRHHCGWDVEKEKRNNLRCWTTEVDSEHPPCFANENLSSKQSLFRLRHLMGGDV